MCLVGGGEEGGERREGERREGERREGGRDWEGEEGGRDWEGEEGEEVGRERGREVGRERGGEDGREREGGREGGRGLHLMHSLGRFVLQQSSHSAINGRRHSNTTLMPSAPCELCGCSIQIERVSKTFQ